MNLSEFSFAMVAAITFFSAVAQAAIASKTTTVSFIHINDHHTHFDEATFDLVQPYIPPGLSVNTSRLRISYGGAARTLAAAKGKRLAAQDKKREVLFLHAGDALTGTIYYTFYGPKPDAALMNVAKFDAFIPGNHEFDQGDANLANFINMINTPVTSANIVPSNTSALRKLGGKSIKPYIIKTMSNGDKIGICGVTVKTETEKSSKPDKGTYLLDERTSATQCAKALTALKINKIVLMTHVGYLADKNKLSGIPGVDLIIGGHSHTLLGGSDVTSAGFLPSGPYAQTVNGTCIVQAWSYSQVVGEVNVTFDSNGKVTNCTGQPFMALNPTLFTVRDAKPVFNLSAADAAIAAKYLLKNPFYVDYGVDYDFLGVIAPYQQQLGAVAAQKIATVSENICLSQIGAVDPFCPDRPLQDKAGGGVCPIVAASFLFNSPTADFAIQNLGGCRADISQGDFTYGDAFTVLPFSNTVVTLVMTGDQIRRVIEDAYNFFLDPKLGGTGGSFPIGAGLRWYVDYTKPFGSRVTNMQMNIRLSSSWTTMDMQRTYTVATNDYIATPLDGYFTFGEIDKMDSTKYVNTYVAYAQSLITYSEYVKVLSEPPAANYSSQYIVFSDGTTNDLRGLSGSGGSTPVTPPTSPVNPPPSPVAKGGDVVVPTARPSLRPVAAPVAPEPSGLCKLFKIFCK